MTNSGQRSRRIAVLGGGISGLAAAYTLTRARQVGAPIEEFLIEANDRLGGLIRSDRVEGFIVEGGPDSFLTQKPEAAALCRELGLGDSLLGSNDRERRTYILYRGRLVPLPDGLMLLVPTRIWPIVTTTLLPLHSKLAIAVERFTFSPNENRQGSADESVAVFVTRHFGRAMLENIADPLLAGIFGGDSTVLSVRSALPQLYEMERKYGSLTRAAMEARRQRCEEAQTIVPEAGATLAANPLSAQSPPLFMTLGGGLEQMVDVLRKRLEAFRVHLRHRVIAIERSPDPIARTYQIRCEGGDAYEADGVVLALPTYECSRLLATLDSPLAESLKAIPYASVLTVALGYEAGECGHLPPGFGFLVPRKERRRLLACTFVHNKFSHCAPPGRGLLRCFLGGTRDPEVLRFGDDEIISMVRQELDAILKLSTPPLFYRIYRWPSSMPQYVVGHEERLKTIQRRIEMLRGLFLAGNAYSGIGISDCIRTGKAAAERAIESCCG